MRGEEAARSTDHGLRQVLEIAVWHIAAIMAQAVVLARSDSVDGCYRVQPPAQLKMVRMGPASYSQTSSCCDWLLQSVYLGQYADLDDLQFHRMWG